MAEATLALDYDGLKRVVAERCGYGHLSGTGEGLTSDQNTEVDLYVKEGQRDFYSAFDWSFLKPIASTTLATDTTTGTTSGAPSHSSNISTVTATAAKFYPTMIGRAFTFDTSGTEYTIATYTSSTVIGVFGDASGEASGDTFTIVHSGAYRLPDDFGGLIGNVMFQAAEGRYVPLENVGVAEILSLQQNTTGTGRPTKCAVSTVAPGLTSGGLLGQRHDLNIWRYADADYVIRYQYQVMPFTNSLSTGEYPYGGAQHAQTLAYACFAAAERSKFKVFGGPDQQQYDRLLAQSVRRDRRHAADSLGIMVSAEPHFSRYGDNYWFPYANNITAGGVSYP